MMTYNIFYSTRNKETLWDFADALREYGFIDAIYITGGTADVYRCDCFKKDSKNNKRNETLIVYGKA
jgi:hypothetical protein